MKSKVHFLNLLLEMLHEMCIKQPHSDKLKERVLRCTALGEVNVSERFFFLKICLMHLCQALLEGICGG